MNAATMSSSFKGVGALLLFRLSDVNISGTDPYLFSFAYESVEMDLYFLEFIFPQRQPLLYPG